LAAHGVFLGVIDAASRRETPREVARKPHTKNFSFVSAALRV
jgi:hypothetical protein